GVLDAWLDFNRDGDWNDADERIFSGQAVVNGVNNLMAAVPLAAAAGTSFARFRLSSAGVLAPTGEAPDGEVEDYQVTILPPNILPTISNITNKSTNEDTPITVNFTVGDADDGTSGLIVSGVSNNQTRVPNANIVPGGSGASRNVTITPGANQSGAATITVTVRDADGGQASRSFTLTINPVNDRPSISNITDRTIPEDGTTGNIAFTLADADNALNTLQLTVNSSNQTLVPLDHIVLGGSGANRSIRVTPVPDAKGFSNITVTVSDGLLSANDVFRVTVTSVNDPPAITEIDDQVVDEDSTTGPLHFTVTDADGFSGLVLSKSSSNPALIPLNRIVFTGSAGDRAVTVTPAANRFGTAVITVTATDNGGASASTSFTVTVNDADDAAPTISSITDKTTAKNTPIVVNFTASDHAFDDASAIVVAAYSGDYSLVLDAKLVISGSGPSYTLTITPEANQTGEVYITVTINDGAGSQAVSTFWLTITEGPGPT
ncbi:MAG: Ig-like domain-containing protein, partial [Nevskiales bacterium]